MAYQLVPVPEMTSFGSALLAFVLTPGLCSIIAVLFGKSIFKKAKTKNIELIRLVAQVYKTSH
uniref:hypothetical protein n=1 Tax=Escherichia coli TaxID=562 RepID=UPI0020353D32|nr:hypothetical protein [Escherichia coli]